MTSETDGEVVSLLRQIAAFDGYKINHWRGMYVCELFNGYIHFFGIGYTLLDTLRGVVEKTLHYTTPGKESIP